MVGIKWGCFSVEKELPRKIRNDGKLVRMWDCVCVCGNHRALTHYEITRKKRFSCGCKAAEQSRKNATIHGDSHKRLHNIWSGMRARCYNINDYHFKWYGGRGITMCDSWRNDYVEFKSWAMKNGYDGNLSIDRIDNDGQYSPENCRWVTPTVQCNNTRRNHFIEIDGERRTITEWSNTSGIKQATIRKRLKLGWNNRDAVFCELQRK